MLLLGLTLVALSLTAFGAYYDCRKLSLLLPTNHLDGAFQTASSLNRLTLGQAPGHDFLPYLGLGPLYVIYPVYAYLGGNIAASVVASNLLIRLLVASIASILFFLVARPKQAWQALLPGLALLLVANLVPTQLPDSVWVALTPGNSLRPFRAFVPYLVALFSALCVTQQWNVAKRFLVLGALPVLSLFWSNDYGIPSAGMFGLFALWFVFRSDKARLKSFLWLVVGGFIGIAVLLGVTRGSLVALMRYNYIDVAKDQWWYFCPYFHSSRVWDLHDIGKIFSFEVKLGLGVLALAIARAALTTRIEDWIVVLVGTATFFGGLVPCVGGHIESGYFLGFSLWRVMIIAVWGLAGVCSFVRQRERVAQSVVLVALATLMITSVYLFSETRTSLANDKARIRKDRSVFYVEELGGYLPVEWKPYVVEARDSAGARTLEEYWGIFSAVQGVPGLPPVDAAIHALGSIRSKFSEVVAEKPEYIYSTRASQTDWQSWNFSLNWWFYRDLLRNYTPTQVGPMTVGWEAVAPVRWPNHPCSVSNNRLIDLHVQGTSRALYEITLHYRLERKGARALFRVRNNINLHDSGYVSLNPDAVEATFPALVAPGNALDVIVSGPLGRKIPLTLEKCSARLVPFSHPEVINVDDRLTPGPLTDDNWERGIARHFAGFYVIWMARSTTPPAIGHYVHFANGIVRRIVAITENPPYLNITVDGAKLDPNVVGYPRTLKITSTPRPELY